MEHCERNEHIPERASERGRPISSLMMENLIHSFTSFSLSLLLGLNVNLLVSPPSRYSSTRHGSPFISTLPWYLTYCINKHAVSRGRLGSRGEERTDEYLQCTHTQSRRVSSSAARRLKPRAPAQSASSSPSCPS